jgi:hypothetical protein
MSMSTGGKVAIGIAIAGALGGVAAAIANASGGAKKVGKLGRAGGVPPKPRGKLVGGCGCGR